MLKKLLIISLILNLAFVLILGYIYYKKQGNTPYVLYNWKNYLHWKERKTHHDSLLIDSSSIVFLGTSLTEGAEWNELLNNPAIKNRGIIRDDTEGLLQRIGSACKGKPKAIFIEEGPNDLHNGVEQTLFISNLSSAIDSIRYYSPVTKIYIQSILPQFDTVMNKKIVAWNEALKSLCQSKGIVFIDLHPHFVVDGKLNPAASYDGVHPNGYGYFIWAKTIKPFI